MAGMGGVKKIPLEHEKKHSPSGQISDRRKGLRFKLDGHRRIKEASAISGHRPTAQPFKCLSWIPDTY